MKVTGADSCWGQMDLRLSPKASKLVAKLLHVWTAPAISIRFDEQGAALRLFPSDRPAEPLGQDIDERLLQIDVARNSLETALAAIDELKQLANRNKKDLDEALARLHEANANKLTAEQEAEIAREIARVDVTGLRKVVCIPTRTQIAWERAIGFGLGVLASLLASLVWWFGGRILG